MQCFDDIHNAISRLPYLPSIPMISMHGFIWTTSPFITVLSTRVDNLVSVCVTLQLTLTYFAQLNLTDCAHVQHGAHYDRALSYMTLVTLTYFVFIRRPRMTPIMPIVMEPQILVIT